MYMIKDIWDIIHGFFQENIIWSDHVNQLDPNDQENPSFFLQTKHALLWKSFVFKSLPLDKQVCNTSFHISRINDV
jgi:hypothetical protein